MALDFESNYLDNIINNITSIFENYFPNSIESSTLSLSIDLNDNSENTNFFRLKTFNVLTDTLLQENLLMGRLPNNTSEILLYQSNEQIGHQYSLYQELELDFFHAYPSVARNYTICGIISDLDKSFLSNNYSSDIVTQNKRFRLNFTDTMGYLFYASPSFDTNTFITSPELFINLLNEVNSTRETLFNLAIDYSYRANSFEIYKINEQIERFRPIYNDKAKVDLEFGNDIGLQIGVDILLLTFYFQDFWLYETIRLAFASLALFAILILSINELFSTDYKELQTIIRKMKVQGISSKTIYSIIALENLFISFFSFIGGLLCGFFIGFCVEKVIGLNFSFTNLLTNLWTPFFIIACSCFIFGFLLIGMINRFRIIKNTSLLDIIIAKPRKHKRMRFLIHILKSKILWFLLCGVFFVFGIVFYIDSNQAFIGYPNLYVYSGGVITRLIVNENVIYSIFLMIFIIGLMFIILLLSILSELYSMLWKYIGEKLWLKHKNFFTFSLRNISLNNKTLVRYFSVLFVSIIIIIPGITLNSSLKNHIGVNAKLANHCTDLVINNFDSNISIEKEMETIPGIERLSEVKYYEILSELGTFPDDKLFFISLLVINTSEYIQLVDFSMDSIEFDFELDDISKLEQNLTFMVDELYAQDAGLNKGTNLYTGQFLLTNLNQTLQYIRDFSVFPGMQRHEELSSPYYHYYEAKIHLIIDFSTYDLIFEQVQNYETIVNETNLLIKTNTDSNIINIQSIIQERYDYNAMTIQDRIEQMTDNTYFSVVYLEIISIFFAVLLLLFLSYLIGYELYNEQLRAIEFGYRIGASRAQLSKSILIKFLLFISLPIILSFILGVALIKIYSLLTNADSSFYPINIHLTWWMISIIFIIISCTVGMGWLLGNISRIYQYKPLKQE